MKKITQAAIILLCALSLSLFGAFAAFADVHAAAKIVLAAVTLLAVAFAAAVMVVRRVKSGEIAKITDSEGIRDKFASIMNIPVALIGQDGAVEWSNPAFDTVCRADNISTVIKGYDTRFPEATTRACVGGRTYDIHTSLLYQKEDGKPRKLCFQYWLDKTDELHYKENFDAVLPTVCLIQLDNYEEVSQSREVVESGAMTEVEKRIASFAGEYGGVLRKYDPGKWIFFLERGMLEPMQKRKMALLDSIREVEGGGRLSLSIGIGVEPTLKLTALSASRAMELALGRGGDQAVVKSGASYLFFGGKRQSVERHSKVKSRMFAGALKNLILQSQRVLIMGHRQSDMDCMGAALGLAHCCQALGRRVNIVAERNNVMVSSFMQDLLGRKDYARLIVYYEEALELCGGDTLLIVVDTQRPRSLALPELYDKCGAHVIIDHHRRSTDALENATLSYLDPSASSASELVTEIMEYFDPPIKPSSYDCAVLLAGITIDTKGFSYNSGVRTFEAASFLRRHGADPGYVKQFFQDDLATYVNRSLVVQSAEIVFPGIALAHCPAHLPDQALLAAQSADALTTIRGLRAAFVLGHMADGIVVSARSIGDINVQVILEAIGGGGHLNVSGAQLSGATYDQARERVISAIKQYMEEE